MQKILYEPNEDLSIDIGILFLQKLEIFLDMTGLIRTNRKRRPLLFRVVLWTTGMAIDQ